MDRKKELKEQYKLMKPDMGVFVVKCNKNNKCYIDKSNNLGGYINRTKFQLGANSHPYKELQKDWNEFGEKEFSIEIIDTLEYDKDESKTDYSDELKLLLLMCQDKLSEDNIEFYKK